MKTKIDILSWVQKTVDELSDKDHTHSYRIRFDLDPNLGECKGVDQIKLSIYKKENALHYTNDDNYNLVHCIKGFNIDECIEKMDKKLHHDK